MGEGSRSTRLLQYTPPADTSRDVTTSVDMVSGAMPDPTRRTLLAAPTLAAAQIGRDSIVVDPQPQFPLSPFLYMQFMEPLGATDGSVEAAWNHRANDWRDDVVAGQADALRPLARPLPPEDDEARSGDHRAVLRRRAARRGDITSGSPRSCAASAGCRSDASAREPRQPR